MGCGVTYSPFGYIRLSLRRPYQDHQWEKRPRRREAGSWGTGNAPGGAPGRGGLGTTSLRGKNPLAHEALIGAQAACALPPYLRGAAGRRTVTGMGYAASMKIRERRTRGIFTVAPNNDLVEVARLMRLHNVVWCP